MNKAIKKLVSDYLRLLFIFSVPWYFEFLPRTDIDNSLLLLIFLFIVFSLFVLNLSIKLVKVLGKENIYSIFYAVPLSLICIPYFVFILQVGFDFSRFDYENMKNFSNFLDDAQYSRLNYLIILNAIMFTSYYKLRD
tara:strand:+ start:184 stop:594 length:411 start_codon:yes stop_codon:yes gene_type:complete